LLSFKHLAIRRRAMSGRAGYFIVTGAVWGALIFVLVVAVVAALRGSLDERRHRRRHELARNRAARPVPDDRDEPEPEAAEAPPPSGMRPV